MQKPGIFGILEYSEPFHHCIPTHIQNPVIFIKIDKPCVILEIQNPGFLKSSQRFKIECFGKIVKSYNYFSKALCLRSLTGFWICPSLLDYSWTCRVTLRYLKDILRTLSIIVNSDIFRHIHVLFKHFQPYCGIFRTRDIFRTLSIHIPAFSERCVKLGYWKTCQSFGIWTRGIFRILFV